MPSSKSQTPVSAGSEHPLHSVSLGDEEERGILLKLGPAILPNNATVDSLRESYPNDSRWSTFRSDFRYIYVMNWLHQCRGYIKLASEYFDTDLFEIELFDLVHPRPVDDMALLVNKIKLGLLSKIHGKKVASLGSFESLYRVYFGSETPLGGPKDTEDDALNTSAYPTFDDLYIDEKISVLYDMMSEVTHYPDFRDFIDRNKLGPDALRPVSIMSSYNNTQNTTEDYLLLFDNTALYKRVISSPELLVPRKRTLAPKFPEEEYGPDAFDIKSVEYELIFKDIYGLDAFVSTLTPKKAKKNKMLLDVLAKANFVSNIFSYESKKRRILSNRKKDFEMTRLLATRKRSSRIEAKEKQKEHEERERKLQELEELKYATNRRSQRNRHLAEHKLKMDYTEGLSREERLKLRKGHRESDIDIFQPTTDIPESNDSFAENLDNPVLVGEVTNTAPISQALESAVKLESSVNVEERKIDPLDHMKQDTDVKPPTEVKEATSPILCQTQLETEGHPSADAPTNTEALGGQKLFAPAGSPSTSFNGEIFETESATL